MSTRAAIRYAKAILNFSLEQQKEVEVNKDMLFIAKTIDESKDLQLLLSSPVLKSETKQATLKEVFASKISPLSFGLIDLLIANKRISLLSTVAKQFKVLFDELKEVQIAKVTSAIALTEDLKTKVLAKVKELTGKEATLQNIINPDIIGGFILRVGDIQYDASVSNKLQVLKRQFENNNFVSSL
ncbi:ATP synthase F1 subcomplex delta subunit [Lutibacter oricola]|uniref:ATP synthase subunit delta n=1 Tax=Lutibacter oricola TaxID=762486 RepID=A0A1H2RBV9_9FLAO|nr:ATP synthase F1 subunit delta [Lutibacter oricola]SDW16907.1 ATP synthase F1 subcomplex delta subunit [Lutibacter oricola]